jgi:NAD(P)-dependent dehydrogenase (short-subunit alcohol dehydrogenase family)
MALEGRVAIVTGSSQGIGKGIALALAQAGARVVINYVSNRELAEEAADAARLIGVDAMAVGADVSQRADVERLFSRALETFGRVDVLVNNAAAFQPSVPLIELSEADWDRIMSVNLKGPFLCAQVAARQMMRQESGVIINISSLGSQVLMHNMGVYCASKGGLETLTRALALELAPHGIRVNAIAPGHIATAGNLKWVAAAPAREERFRARIALGRLGRIEEIGSTAVFLASDASAYITGQILYADGGIMMWQGPILD